jgi:hypothetical protein
MRTSSIAARAGLASSFANAASPELPYTLPS